MFENYGRLGGFYPVQPWFYVRWKVSMSPRKKNNSWTFFVKILLLLIKQKILILISVLITAQITAIQICNKFKIRQNRQNRAQSHQKISAKERCYTMRICWGLLFLCNWVEICWGIQAQRRLYLQLSHPKHWGIKKNPCHLSYSFKEQTYYFTKGCKVHSRYF